MENNSNFVIEEEDFDPHDADIEGEEVKISKECQTLHEHLMDEINGILKSLESDEKIKNIIKKNRTSDQKSFERHKGKTKHKVRLIININYQCSIVFDS